MAADKISVFVLTLRGRPRMGAHSLVPPCHTEVFFKGWTLDASKTHMSQALFQLQRDNGTDQLPSLHQTKKK